MKNKLCILVVSVIIGLAGACTSPGNKTITKTLPVEKFQATLENERGVLIDVRSPGEYAESHIDGAFNFNVESDSFNIRINTLDKNKSYFLYCRSGKRSARAMDIMEKTGFNKLYNLEGGITAWRNENMPVTKR